MALFKYHYIELDTKRSPRISLQNIVAGETGNLITVSLTNDEETVNLAEKSGGEFIYRVALRVDSDLGTRRQDSAAPNSGITFVESGTDAGKVQILLSCDTYTAGKNRCTLEIYSTRTTENDTLVVSAEVPFTAKGKDHENTGVAMPAMVYLEQLAKSYARGGTGVRDGENIDNAKYYKDLAEQAVQGGIVDPTIDAWLDDHSTHIDGVIVDEVDDWLDAHPEATTTVEDGAITDAKLSAEVKAKYALADDVNKLKIEKPLDYSTGTAYTASISPSSNKWNVSSNVMGYIIPLSQALKITIKSNATNGSIFAFLKTDNHVHGTIPDYATGSGRRYIAADTTQTVIVPNDANYIYITDHLTNNVSYLPQSVMLSTYIDASAAFEEMENDLNTLKSYHPNYSGKKISILGDSISTFAVPSEKTDGKAAAGCTTNYPGNPVQYSNSDVTNVSATWWGRVLNHFGMVLGINESWAGSTIGYNPHQTSGGKYTADNCLCSATRIGHLGENGTPDIIIVFGGTNDINHHRLGTTANLRYAVGQLDSENNPYDYDNFPMITDTYYGSITTMLLRIQHTYPNATVLMLLPYFCTYTHTSSGDLATPYDQNEWSNAAIDVCKYLGVEYLDLRSIINLYDVSSLLFDELHPKANGMTAIAKAVIHKLNNML